MTTQQEPRGLDSILDHVPEGIRSDFGDFIQSAVMGGVWSREEQLAPKYRSMITIAALTALNRQPELALHIRGGLMRGLTKQEISEIVMHMAIYGGFPVAVEGMRVAKEVFDSTEA